MTFTKPNHFILDTKLILPIRLFILNFLRSGELSFLLTDATFFYPNLDAGNKLLKKLYNLSFNQTLNSVSDFYSNPISFFKKNSQFLNQNLMTFSIYPPQTTPNLPKIKNVKPVYNEDAPMFQARLDFMGNTQLKLNFSSTTDFNNNSSTLGYSPSHIDTEGPDLPLGTSRVRLLSLKSLSNYNIFDINYIKRERLYTKLKYSRSPAYDIVSGGAAAFLAAFIGFLVSEKFGIELVDSGDFYIAFMYAIFIGLTLKPFMRILQNLKSFSSKFFNHLCLFILRFFLTQKRFFISLVRAYLPHTFIISKLLIKILFVSYITILSFTLV
jgi:hypothetical protein